MTSCRSAFYPESRFNIVVIFFLLILTTAPVYSVDLANGERLHQENCMQCHTPEIYQRENRIVNNFDELDSRVRQCELTNELTWFDEEIDDVINYLNVNYYMFQIK